MILFAARCSRTDSGTVWRQCRRALCLLLCISVVGCGSSKMDPLERAKLRRRNTAPEPTEKPASAVDPQVAQDKAGKPVAEPKKEMPDVALASKDGAMNESGDNAETERLDEAIEEPDVPEVVYLPVSERKPEQPLTDEQRRERAADNMRKVGEAVIQYAKRTSAFPVTVGFRSDGGIPTLSWRVAILPELGYEDLYRRFDPNEPWDGPNNSKLLDLIPDEFVSPERFDAKTNILGPASPSFLFGSKKIQLDGIEDGDANTIMLLEVDETHAQPWTKPKDYEAGYEEGFKGMGKLRGDGTIAIWANGMPTLIPNNASPVQLLNAFSYESGDGQKAVVLHRPITVEKVTEESVATMNPDSLGGELPSSGLPQQELAPEPEPEVVRTPVPTAIDVAEASKKLRVVFAKRMEEARTEADKGMIASEMVKQASEMPEDPAGAFALLNAAGALANQAGEFQTAVDAVETKIRIFEVDAYEENAAMMVAFGNENGGRRAQKAGGDEYVTRAIRVIFAGIRADDFVRASSIARYALMFKGERGQDETVTMLTRLRTQLSVARGHYSRTGNALAQLRIEPNDPAAVEEVGRFLCFIKGDWDAGLPLLARSENTVLNEIAKADIAGADAPAGMLVLADAWWDLSSRTTQGVFRQACRDRAVAWYTAAHGLLPDSLDKLHCKARLDEAGEADASSPLALVKNLAQESNVDLNASLAGIAVKRNRRNDDDD